MKHPTTLPSSVLRVFARLAALATALAAATETLAQRTVTLAWNPPADNSAAGFYIYSYEEGTDTPVRMDAGLTTRKSIGGLREGLQYRFAVTAYNTERVESPRSNEVVVEIPVPILLNRPAGPAAVREVRFPAAPGLAYVVEASTNLLDWSPIWQTGVATAYGWVEIPDLESANLPRRFYRLKILRPEPAP